MKRLLLDTHVVLWWRAEPGRLSARARAAIAVADAVFVSAASVWEIEIKAGVGRIRLPEPFVLGVQRSGFVRLPVTFEHAARVGALPRHHADPFDRMLVAQAMEEDLVLVTADARVLRYDVTTLVAT